MRKVNIKLEENMLNYGKLTEVKALLASRNWRPQKKMGQNYLIDEGSLALIWKTLYPKATEVIWEIGAGLGALTHKLAGRGEPFWVFELDRGYASFLEESFGTQGLHLILGDVLKTWKDVYDYKKPDKILGNLPYHISSQIILSLIQEAPQLPCCVFTVQKELADRLVARVGEKQYSAFSLLVQWAFKVKLVRTLPSGCFYPRPKVLSAVVVLTPYHRYTFSEFSAFQSLVKGAFSARRKVLRNSLVLFSQKQKIPLETIEKAFCHLSLSLGQRAEELTLDQYAQLASVLCQN